MRILIDVYLSSLQNIRTDLPELGAWDTLGVSEELDFSLKQFPKTAFISAKSTSSKYATTTDGAYSWRVQVPTAQQLAQLNIKALPTILFFDLDSQKYVARVEGTPQGRGVVAQLLRGIIQQNDSTMPKATQAGLWLLGLLLFLKIKQA